MAFDAEDPYDAAALYDMWLNCSRCPVTFDYEPGGEINLDYYHRLGQRARQSGWAILPAQHLETELVFTVLCPRCAHRLGVADCDGSVELAAPVIERICQAMEKLRAA